MGVTINKKSTTTEPNSVADMVSYTPQFKHKKNNKKKPLQITVQKGAGCCMPAVCTHVASSAAPRDIAVKLATDSYQFWVAH